MISINFWTFLLVIFVCISGTAFWVLIVIIVNAFGLFRRWAGVYPINPLGFTYPAPPMMYGLPHPKMESRSDDE